MALTINSLSSSLAPNSADLLAQLARQSASSYTSDGSASDLGGDAQDGLGALDFALAGVGTSAASRRASSVDAAGAGAAALSGTGGATSFQDAMLKALDGVSASQNKGDDLLQKVVADPNSVDVQDVTIAMAEANMSLNLAKTILSRIVTAWKDVINTH